MRIDDWMAIIAWQSRALLLEAEELPAEVPLETVFRCKLKVTIIDDGLLVLHPVPHESLSPGHEHHQ
jgi:hypothetical protein